MGKVVINWRGAKILLAVLYILALLLPILLALVQGSIAIFLSALTAFTLIFYYLYKRILLAEAEQWTVSARPSVKEALALQYRVSGGFLKLLLLAVGAAITGVLTLVVASAL